MAWENKTEKAFWRGRDSRQERLDLVVMSRKEPELIDAALTHMFFFKKEPEKYGELVKSTPFFDFFNVSLVLIYILYFPERVTHQFGNCPMLQRFRKHLLYMYMYVPSSQVKGF